MMFKVPPFVLLIPLSAVAALSGCQQTTPTAALTTAMTASETRQMTGRRFDINDERAVLTSIVQLLQDLGYKVGETDVKAGLVTGTKGAEEVVTYYGSIIRVTVTTTPIRDKGGIQVRATFQDIVQARDPRYTYARSTVGPEVYQQFFDRLAQSLFLEAHDI
ncbi:MAG: hypothetical protein HQL36_05025 [Alphaproteobacteria bacterium]|nr:hypothetical protein [Alphaproteobacteria bacterium]MBF0249844.1 hypothetical protein [Alphaproteobacteria bacterium]